MDEASQRELETGEFAAVDPDTGELTRVDPESGDEEPFAAGTGFDRRAKTGYASASARQRASYW